jgi:hypothetical protein
MHAPIIHQRLVEFVHAAIKLSLCFLAQLQLEEDGNTVGPFPRQIFHPIASVSRVGLSLKFLSLVTVVTINMTTPRSTFDAQYSLSRTFATMSSVALDGPDVLLGSRVSMHCG